MFRLTATFVFLAIGLVSGQTIQPSPTFFAPISNSTTPSTSINNSTNPSSTVTTPSPSSSPSSSMLPSLSSTISPSNATSPTSKPTHFSTTTPKPKPTPKPTPKPKLRGGDYSIKEDGKYCLLAILDAVFMIPYKEKTGNKTTDDKMVMVQMPFNNTNTTKSKCGSNPVLVINWKFYKFTMEFKGKVKGGNGGNVTDWEVNSLMLVVTTKGNPDFKNATKESINLKTNNETELDGLKAGMKGYYTCAANRTYPFKTPKAEMFLKYVKLQPFGVVGNKTQELFGKEYNCEQPKPTPVSNKDDNNIVPIAVGCALAGLVLIVLIAYIIGRRKSQRGYEKV